MEHVRNDMKKWKQKLFITRIAKRRVAKFSDIFREEGWGNFTLTGENEDEACLYIRMEKLSVKRTVNAKNCSELQRIEFVESHYRQRSEWIRHTKIITLHLNYVSY